MTRKELDQFLDFLDINDQWIFSIRTAEVYFQEIPNTLRHSLARHTMNGAIIRLARGLYANLRSRVKPLYALEGVVLFLRSGCVSYLSLESRLSELGVISQVPTRLTIKTTGRSQLYETPIGTIEFTHTNRKVSEYLDAFKYDQERKIFICSPKVALEDLRNSKRNMGLVDFDEYYLAQEEWEAQDPQDL